MGMKLVFLTALFWIYTYTLQGDIITGYANTHENERTVSGNLCLDIGDSYFTGNWTRNGNIEAVNAEGNIYLFNVSDRNYCQAN